MMDLMEITNILETMDDELLAANLLRELSEKNSKMKQIHFNRDPQLDHNEWKAQCDEAENEVNEVVKKIENILQ